MRVTFRLGDQRDVDRMGYEEQAFDLLSQAVLWLAMEVANWPDLDGHCPRPREPAPVCLSLVQGTVLAH